MIKKIKIIKILLIIFCVVPLNVYAQPTDADIFWLTQNIYWEGRNQSNIGQLMIGIVTLERLNSKRWGNTVKKVVTAKNQFSWFFDGKSDIPKNKKAWKEAKEIALLTYIVMGALDTKGFMYYHNININPYWTKNMKKEITVEDHVFYRSSK